MKELVGYLQRCLTWAAQRSQSLPETRELKRKKNASPMDLGVHYSQRGENVIDLWVLEVLKGPWWLPAIALPGW